MALVERSRRTLRRAVAPVLSLACLAASFVPADAPERARAQTEDVAFRGSELSNQEILRHLSEAPPLRIRVVGHTPAVLKLSLRGPIDAAFKPSSEQRPRGYRAEVAAYRLARCLGMDNVPPAVTRSIELASMPELLRPIGEVDWEPLREQFLADERGALPGAAVFWIPDLSAVDLQSRPDMARWRQWLLVDHEVAAERHALAADLSEMIAFDYLIGNADRFSGGNARGNEEGTHLYVRDHDLAFPSRVSVERHQQLIEPLMGVQRFSRRFVRRLMQLDEATLDTELARDPADQLLGPSQRKGLFDRRQALLTYVGSLIELHGAERVLAFP